MNRKIFFALLFFTVGAAGAAAQPQVQRRSVLEEFSTALCQYCPEGYQIIKKAVDSHPGTIWLVHHAGFMTDDITITASEQLTFLYAANAFAPAYMVDRTIPQVTYNDYSPVWGVDDSARVAGHLDEMAAKPCFTTVDIGEVAYDVATRTVSATVSGRVYEAFDTAITRLSLFLVEDSIVMPQASTTGTISNYLHMHAVRGCATDPTGTPLAFAPDGSYSFPVRYTLPPAAVASHCRLVALVHYYKATNLTKNIVLNAAATEGYLCSHTAGIAAGAEQTVEMTVSPNPATDHATIVADSPIRSIAVTDIRGRRRVCATAQGESAYTLDTRGWPSGVYILRLTTDAGPATRKLMVH